jgi:hypothetical protein
MPPTHAQLTISFELDSEPISGSLRDAAGRATAFNGWIEFVAMLQKAATSPARQASEVDAAANGDPCSRWAL